MSQWPSTKARLVLAALLRIGWTIKRQSGTSHRVLARPGFPDVTFASFGPAALTAAKLVRSFFVETREVENEGTRSKVGE